MGVAVAAPAATCAAESPGRRDRRLRARRRAECNREHECRDGRMALWQSRTVVGEARISRSLVDRLASLADKSSAYGRIAMPRPSPTASGRHLPVSMQRINIPPQGLTSVWLTLQTGFATLDARWSSIEPASADASFRRYFRVRSANDDSTAIVMDVPPPEEDVRPFLNISRFVCQWRCQRVPVVYAADETRGLLLLGISAIRRICALLTDAADGERQRLFSDAINTLVQLQQIDPAPGGSTTRTLRRCAAAAEIDLFPEWYLGRHLPD